MADPTKFTPGYSYSDWQAENPRLPLPAPEVDDDFANIATSVNETIDALKEIRRSDGALNNQIVTLDSLAPEVRNQIGEGATDARDAAIEAAQQSAQSASASAASAGAAAGSAGTAATSAGQAMTFRNTAQTARDGAVAARDFAAQWASAPIGQQVNDGVNPTGYSAYHWAEVAEGAAGGNLPDNAVTTAKLANNAVTTPKLADEAVTNAKVASPASPADAISSMKLSFTQAGTGAATRSVQNRLRDYISVKDFGAVGDGTTDDTAAFKAARDFLQTNSEYRGGRIYIPKGRYRLTDQITFTYYAAGLVHNITLFGDGPQATVLDFANAPAGTDGLSFGKGVHYAIEDLSVANARRDGISLIGGALGTDDFAQQIRIKNVRVSFSVRDGFYSQNIFMARFEDCWATYSGRVGFNFAGFHTSLHCSRSWASNSTEAGWVINNAVYCSFNTCASDENQYGYAVSNVAGIVFSGCGAESNRRDSWLFVTNTNPATQANEDIHGVVLQGCFGFRAGLETPGQFANLVAAVTSNNRPINITIISCKTVKAAANDPSMVVNGASGRIKISEKNCTFDGPIASFSNVQYEGRRFPFTPTVVGTTTAGAATYSAQEGFFEIVDGVLTFSVRLQWTGHTGSGGAAVITLPMAPINTISTPMHVGSLTFSGSLSGLISANTQTLFCTVSASGAAPAYAILTASGLIIASGSYFVGT